MISEIVESGSGKKCPDPQHWFIRPLILPLAPEKDLKVDFTDNYFIEGETFTRMRNEAEFVVPNQNSFKNFGGTV